MQGADKERIVEVVRRRLSMPLTAGWVRARRAAARVTLRSSSGASSVFSRFRSSVRRSAFMMFCYLFPFTIMALPAVDALRFPL